MGKWTKGPWRLVIARVRPESPSFGYSVEGDGKACPIASAGVYVGHGPFILEPEHENIVRHYNEQDKYYLREEMEANARLIAAAPELAECLREMVEAHGVTIGDCGHSACPLCLTIRTATALLARLDGEA